MRVLFTSQPAVGHWHPLVSLAQALQAAGHEVAFASTPDFCKTIESKGFRCFHAGIGESPEELRQRRQHLSTYTPPERAQYMWQNVFAGSRAKNALPDLLTIIQNWQPDILVRDNTEIAGCVAAERANIPHASVQITAARTRLMRLIQDQFNSLCSLVGLPHMDPEETMHRYLLLLPRPLSMWDPSFPLPPTTHTFRYIGFNESGDEQLPSWVEELDERPTVYATLGTVVNILGNEHSAILEALRDQPINLILTIGRDLDPAAFGPQPPNVHIERYIPQNLILPYCDMAISHAGSGTIMDTLSFGIPMVLIPIQADQPQNAQLCADLGVARVIPPDQRTAAAIRDAFLEVLQNPNYRQAAQKLQQEIEALPGLDYPVALLEQLVAQRTPISS